MRGNNLFAGTPSIPDIESFDFIEQILLQEYGKPYLPGRDAFDETFNIGRSYDTSRKRLFDFILNDSTPTEHKLDAVEVFIGYYDHLTNDKNAVYHGITQESAQALAANINERMRRAGFGYQYESGRIIRIDSQLLHSEAVKPALVLLQDVGFNGASDEFITAYSHYRHGRIEDSLTTALKAFESTMKSICTRLNDMPKDHEAAGSLISRIMKLGIIPDWMEDQCSSIEQGLTAGALRIRNKLAGHGAGEQPRDVPAYMAAYQLHLTAAAMLMMVSAYKHRLKLEPDFLS